MTQASLVEAGIGLAITRLANEFGMSAATVNKRIAGTIPCARRHGYPVYQLKDVAHLLVDPAKVRNLTIGDNQVNGQFDPNKLPPKERKDWFSSEVDRLKVEKDAAHLVPASEVEKEMAAMLRPVAALLETLPDILERDCDLTPDQVAKVQQVCDAERARIYQVLQT